MVAYVLIAAAMAGTGPVPAQQPVVEQAVEVCGTVAGVMRGFPEGCDATLKVSAEGVEWGVIVPAAIRQQIPGLLPGATACFSGSLWLANEREQQRTGTASMLRVASVTGVRISRPAPAPDPAFLDVVEACGQGVRAPRIISERRPAYSREAMRERVQGVVELDAIVDTSGAVSHVRVTRPLHPALDQQAIQALRQWKFAPGTRDGQPVRTLVSVEMTFTLRTDR